MSKAIYYESFASLDPMQRDGEAKIWLSPLSVAESDGFGARLLRELLSIAAENRDLIERAWHEHFA